MPDTLFEFHVGSDELLEFIRYAGVYAYDMHDLIDGIKQVVQLGMEEQFETEGMARTGGWIPLADDYQIWKDSHMPNTMLKLTNEMYSIISSEDSWFVTMQHAFFLPPSEKAGWHQEGVPFRRTRGWQPRNDAGRFMTKRTAPNPLPARPFLVWDESDDVQVDVMIADWLERLKEEHTGFAG